MADQLKALEAKVAVLEELLAAPQDNTEVEALKAQVAALENQIKNLPAAPVTNSVGKVQPQPDTIPAEAFKLDKKSYKFKFARFTLRAVALGATETAKGTLTGKLTSISAKEALKNKELLQEIVERYPSLVEEA